MKINVPVKIDNVGRMVIPSKVINILRSFGIFYNPPLYIW